MGRPLRLTIAAVLVGGSLTYVVFGRHKGYGIGAGVISVFLCRFLVLDGEPRRPDD